MIGKNITTQVYNNGLIKIPNVYDNVTINVETSSINKEESFFKRDSNDKLENMTLLNRRYCINSIKGNSMVFAQRASFSKIHINVASYGTLGTHGSTVDATDIYANAHLNKGNYDIYISIGQQLAEGYLYYYSVDIKFPNNTDLTRAYIGVGPGTSAGWYRGDGAWRSLTNGCCTVTGTFTPDTFSGYTNSTAIINFYNKDSKAWIPDDGVDVVISNFHLINLTYLFGKGHEISDVSEIQKLFPLKQYDCTTGFTINNTIGNIVSKRYDAIGVNPIICTNYPDYAPSGTGDALVPDENGVFSITISSGGYATLRTKWNISTNTTDKYYLRCYVNSPSGAVGFFDYGGYTAPNISINHTGFNLVSVIRRFGNRPDVSIQNGTEGDIAQFKWPLYINLTAMFGAGNEPTKAECDQMFAHVQFNSAAEFNKWNILQTVGLYSKESPNIWDEQWESGGISSTGELNNNNFFRSKNYISVVPGEKIYYNYHRGAGSTYDIQCGCYDINQNPIGRSASLDGSYTIPENTYFIKFYLHSEYGHTAYGNDVIFSRSYKPTYVTHSNYANVYSIRLNNLTGKIDKSTLLYDSEIEYLESSGTQYINTTIYGSQDLDFEITFQLPSLTGNQYENVLGDRIDVDTNRYSLMVDRTSENYAAYVNCGSSNQVYVSNTYRTTDIVTYKKVGLNAYINDTLIGTFTEEEFSTPNSIILFGARNNNISQGTSSLSVMLNGRIMSCKFTYNGTLVRDFIPVRKDGIGYMYDKVYKVLYGNQGSGSFILGPDVKFKSNIIFPLGLKSAYLPYTAQVDYIEKTSEDTSALLFDYVPYGSDIKIKAKIRIIGYTIDGNFAHVLGTISVIPISGSGDWYTKYRIAKGQSYDTYIYGQINCRVYNGLAGFSLNNDHVVEISYGKTKVDNSSYDSNTTIGWPSPAKNFSFFNNVKARLYYCQVYKGDQLMMDIIPVRVGTTATLYDKVSKKLATQNSTWDENTTWVYGTDVESDMNQVRDEIRKDEDGVWRAYKRLSDKEAKYTSTITKRSEYVLMPEEVYILDDQNINNVISHIDGTIEEFGPRNDDFKVLPVSSVPIFDVQYGGISNE